MSFPRYLEYKDSGAEWLGDVPSHWRSSFMRWLSRRYSGGTPDKTKLSFWEDGTIPWLNSGAVNDRLITEPSTFITGDALAKSSAKWIPKGALVMALAGQGKTKGMVAQLAIASTCNQSMAAIIPGPEILSRFLFWWLESNYQNIRNMAGGDLRDGLNLELLGNICCPLPSLAEQTTIVAFLDRETAKIDALVAEQRRMIELLKEKRQAVISHAVTKGLHPDAPMKDSGIEWLGEVPAHWEVCIFKRLAREAISGPYGSSLTKAMYVGEGYRVYGQQQVILDEFSIGDYYISSDKYSQMERYSVKPRDLLITVMGTIGAVAVVPEGVDPGIINPRLVLYRVDETSLLPEFAQALFRSDLGRVQLDSTSKGTTMEGLNMEIIGSVRITVPPVLEQQSILSFLRTETTKFDALTTEAQRAIDLLQERRTALISAAVTGQIDVRGFVSPSHAR
ncbi:MAG: restriction endonuclease subunit S [Verrucomicrobiae bacterium]|nr:restriction endonuclease subunit S [Verrucomicrobiae bacterium]